MGSDITFVLLGNSGVGKSASGNTILGRDAFESRPSFGSVTTNITEVTGTVFGRQISVWDTPGVLENDELVRKWCKDLLTGPRTLFLVVLSAGRFTGEQQKAVKAVTEILGQDGLKKSLMLFTNGESLNMSLDDFIFEENSNPLPDLIRKFTGKYHLFHNANRGQEQVRELLIKADRLLQTGTQGPIAPERPPLEEMRIVLLGLPGQGKSSTGNTILGSEQFVANCDFDNIGTNTVSKSAEVDGRLVKVVDTPGISERALDAKKLYEEIMTSVVEASPGPHALIIVMRIGRISKGGIDLIQMLQMLFGSGANNHAIVLFTHGDQLGGQSIGEKIKSHSQLSQLVSKCKGGYCVFDNKGRRSRQQVHDLIEQIDEMVEANNGNHFTSEMFEMAYNFMQEAAHDTENQEPGTRREEEVLKRMRRFFLRAWERISSCFMGCLRSSSTTSDDEEGIPLTSRGAKMSHGLLLPD